MPSARASRRVEGEARPWQALAMWHPGSSWGVLLGVLNPGRAGAGTSGCGDVLHCASAVAVALLMQCTCRPLRLLPLRFEGSMHAAAPTDPPVKIGQVGRFG